MEFTIDTIKEAFANREERMERSKLSIIQNILGDLKEAVETISCIRYASGWMGYSHMAESDYKDIQNKIRELGFKKVDLEKDRSQYRIIVDITSWEEPN
jgi:hypothetical protein